MSSTFRQSLDLARAGRTPPYPLFTIKARHVATALWEVMDQHRDNIYHATFMAFTLELVLAYEMQLGSMPDSHRRRTQERRMRLRFRPALVTLWARHCMGTEEQEEAEVANMV
ncbi:hypothetical protein R3P38DRAFT_3207524 [Favolaschia claudopus]|uniref:Uncharacterized protein n=1 Tax=Favolaschia claudopus TaxID=2862362 RepID=A0AAV9ZP11_9AGAR